MPVHPPPLLSLSLSLQPSLSHALSLLSLSLLSLSLILHSSSQYTDALRCADLDRFRAIEAAAGHWWHPTLDRGAGAALHAAVDAGALASVRLLLATPRSVPVNQRDARPHGGWTPLHRAAVVAHHTHVPGLAVFEALLAAGADPGATVEVERDWPPGGEEEGSAATGGTPTSSPPARRTLTVLDLAVKKGHGWAPGAVRARLAAAIAVAAGVPKAPACPPYAGPPHGPVASALLATWAALPPRYPPPNWRPPPPAGFLDAGGSRPGAWAPAGTPGDGSCFVRPARAGEVAAAAAAAAGAEQQG